jgi:para-nitrobenzyl esterase
MATRREFTAGAAALVVGACASTPAASTPEPVVETAKGKLRGALVEGVHVFKGIPYGASTAGAARFKPPQAPDAWAGVRDALAWGPNAPQMRSGPVVPTGMGSQMAEFFGFTPDVPDAISEDCLVLNVFTPDASRARKRPVMVWFHGGGFEVGTGSGSRSNGSNLARQYDVVTVTINHRLGVLGYADLSAYGEEYARSGNAGQLDLLLALEWVRDNIEGFGGDPANVLIHGESGGSAKVGTVLAMPGGNGLFHRAICQSGAPRGLPTRERGAEAAAALLRELQIDASNLARIQEVPALDLVAAGQRATAAIGGSPMSGRGFAPLVGVADLPVDPFEAVAAGASRNVPLIIGCTKHEAALFLAGAGLDTTTITEERLQQMAPMTLGPQHAELLAGYRANHPDYTPGELLVRAQTDAMMRYPSIKFAEARLRGGGPTWMYMFTWESPVLPHLHAAHGIDGTFYFNNTESVNIAAGNTEAQALAGKTSAAWSNFAKDGAPSAPGLPQWPQYTVERRETMIFSAEPHIESDPLGPDRQLRERLAG